MREICNEKKKETILQNLRPDIHDENKDETSRFVKDEDEQSSKNTPPDTEAPPDAPAKLGEDTTVKTPEDISMEGRKLH